MTRIIYPKDYIEEVLINELGGLISTHAYFSFFLVCAGIEFLGICLDDTSDWFDENKSKSHFEKAIKTLFPSHYHNLSLSLYKNLRCGLLHCSLPKGYSLTELKKDPGGLLKYDEHLIKNCQVIVIDYFYKDFVEACKKIISATFSPASKMAKPLLNVG